MSNSNRESSSGLKPLNSEENLINRRCQLEVAEDLRAHSSKRNDVDETTDNRACEEMFAYTRSDSETLDTHKDSEVANFYKGRSVFITGASGFVGKCILEKLLRSCPDIKHVFILMRPKRGKDVGERVESLLNMELFDRLRKSMRGQEQFRKIVPIRGDITKPLFGVSNEDLDLLSSKVSLVIHSAATVKFVEPLKVAIENNVVSVENLINLASKLTQLEALVHVSTAYSNCDRKQVDEIFYETPIQADKLIDMTQWMNPETIEEISPILRGKRPNTYTYTKAVAESLLLERSKKLLPDIPIAMVRPSIVAGIWRQPICGWVDNFNGPTGVVLSMMTGAIRAMLANPEYCADIVPVDIVANLIVCAAWQVHQEGHKVKREKERDEISQSSQISVYNCVSGTLNPVVWRDIAKYIEQIAKVYPCNTLLGRPGRLLIKNSALFKVYNFINHTIPAHICDFTLKMAGQKPKLVMIHQRMMKMINTLKPFTTNQWDFDCSNVVSLYDKLTIVDKEIFNFDIRQVRWDDYLRSYYIGSKTYALKDDPYQVALARQKLRKISTGVRITQLLFLTMIYYFFICGTPMEEFVVRTLGKLSIDAVATIKDALGHQIEL